MQILQVLQMQEKLYTKFLETMTNERGVEGSFKVFKVLRYQSGSVAVTPAKGAPTLPLVERGCPKVPRQRDLQKEHKDCIKGSHQLRLCLKIMIKEDSAGTYPTSTKKFEIEI